MAKQIVKPSSYFSAAFCFLALLVFNMIEDNFYSVVFFFSLFFLSLVIGINQRFNLIKSKEQKKKRPSTFNVSQ